MSGIEAGRLRPARVMAVVVAGLSACATSSAPPTIEPPQVKGADEGRAQPATFVLRKDKSEKEMSPADIVLFMGEDWWPHRAAFLKQTPAQTKARDAAVSEKEPPPDFWDEQTAGEAVATWTALCNECHGGKRLIQDALAMPPPSPRWGRGEGFFFGKRRPYAELFGVVTNGGPTRNGVESDMPPWRNKLSREMIWSLLYFLEYQSGGVEGHFPPSLTPKVRDDRARVPGR